MQVFLETERLILRRITPDDVDLIVELDSDPAVMRFITGGRATPREEIERVAGLLHDTLKLQRVAPGHCTSEPGFAAFMRKFGDRFDQAGLGATVPLPH